MTPDQPQVVRIALTPAAVVLGRVLAPDGEPVENVRVTLLRPGRAPGQAEFSLTGMTNDAGEFRIPRVEPGPYLLMSTPPGNDSGDGVVVPTYYPGTPSASEARRVEVAKGATVTGLDFVMQTVKTGTIAGIVLDPAGQPVQGADVRVSSPGRGHEDVAISMPGLASSHTGADGRFQLRLPAGEHWLKVSQSGRGVGSIPLERALGREHSGFASARVSVAAETATDVRLQLERSVTIRGRFVFEGRTSASEMSAFLGAALARFILAGGPGDGKEETQAAPTDPTTNPTAPDLSFELLAAPGTYVASAIAGPGWTVKAIQFGSEDVTNRPITLEPGRTVENARIIFTDRPNSVSLRVLDASGSPTTDYIAFVFPVDERLWTTPALLRLHIPGQHVIDRRIPAMGIELGPVADYSAPIGGLPPGHYYAVALDDARWDDFNDPGVLQGWRSML